MVCLIPSPKRFPLFALSHPKLSQSHSEFGPGPGTGTGPAAAVPHRHLDPARRVAAQRRQRPPVRLLHAHPRAAAAAATPAPPLSPPSTPAYTNSRSKPASGPSLVITQWLRSARLRVSPRLQYHGHSLTSE